jgi:hypothetical protein
VVSRRTRPSTTWSEETFDLTRDEENEIYGGRYENDEYEEEEEDEVEEVSKHKHVFVKSNDYCSGVARFY